MAANDFAITVDDAYPHVPSDFAASNHSISREPLADGVDGTIQTLELMASTVRGGMPPDHSGFADVLVRKTAAAIVGRYRGASPLAALFLYVRDSISYIDHPWNEQVVQDCRRTLELRTGDCVSKSVCLSTLAASLQFTPRFVAQCPDGAEFNHVYVEVWDGGQWLPLDPTADGQGGRPLGGVGWFQVLPDYGCEMTQNIF